MKGWSAKLKLRGRISVAIAFVLVVALIASYLLGVLQRQALLELTTVVTPARNHAHEAQTAFRNWKLKYQDAVQMAEPDELEGAERETATLVVALMRLAEQEDLDAEICSSALTICSRFESFRKIARPIYRKMAAGHLNTAERGRLSGLAAESKAIDAELQALSSRLGKLFEDGVTAVQRGGSLALAVNLLVIPLAIWALHYALSVLVIRPLDRLVATVEEFEKGNFSHEVPFHRDDEFGRLGAGMATMRDAIKTMIAEIRESKENLRITLNSIGDAVIATNGEGIIQRMNPVAEELTGWTMKEARKQHLRTCFRVVDSETGEPTDSPLVRVLGSGEVVGPLKTRTLISKDGTELCIADSGAPIRDNTGQIVGMVLVFRDVTRENQLEEQLRQAQKMESVGQLAGGIAHDFNNMLGGIRGAADLLMIKLDKDSELLPMVSIIEDASTRAAEMTQKLLMFSRKGSVTMVPTDAHEVLSQVKNLLARTIDKRIEIEILSNAKHAVVYGNHTQLQNAILNLGVNARDAMPNGGFITFITDNTELDADYCSRSPFPLVPGPYLKLMVRDTGIGMPASVISRIFEPFFTTKGEGKGTGLGLSGVYGTVKDHKGEIHVYSESGKGTIFKIYLPLAKDAQEEGVKSKTEVTLGEGRILLVDDEPIIRTTGKAVLEELGYLVTTAEDGFEAVELFRHQSDEIDLVLLDMVMPKMGGRETFLALQKIDLSVRVLFSSGFEKDKNIERLINEGGCGFVQKPYRGGELSQCLARALGNDTSGDKQGDAATRQ